jgi:hypothetical protein
MSYFSNLDIIVRSYKAIPEAPDCECGSPRFTFGFKPPNTLIVTCQNPNCRWWNVEQEIKCRNYAPRIYENKAKRSRQSS